MKWLIVWWQKLFRKPPPIPPRKPPTTKKPRIPQCPQTDKYMFTREQAINRRDLLAPKGKLRVYCCEFCNTWHLTHQKLKNNP